MRPTHSVARGGELNPCNSDAALMSTGKADSNNPGPLSPTEALSIRLWDGGSGSAPLRADKVKARHSFGPQRPSCVCTKYSPPKQGLPCEDV